MKYFRYRSNSELSFKELLYSEIFFASNEECNDPFDSKPNYSFGSDRAKWSRLVNHLLPKFLSLQKSLTDRIIDSLINISPMSYMEAQQLELSTHNLLNLTKWERPVFAEFEKKFKALLEQYEPENSYFACFSKSRNDPLLWAHYASRHEGYL